MFKQRFLVISLLFAGAVQCAHADQLQWLQYHSARQARDIVGDIGSHLVELIDDKPEGVQLPEFTSTEPIFAKWKSPMVNNGYLWIALDRSQKNKPCDSLYIDSNGDGNLSDEKAIAPYQTEQNKTYFGPVKITYQYEDEPVTYHLNFEFYIREDRRQLYVSSGGWYEGSVTVAGEQNHCVLIDQNTNGRFNDKSDNFSKSDRIRIGKKDNRDTKFTGNYIDIDGGLYRTDIAPDGACITLTKAEGVTYGRIRLDESITEFAAGGENGFFSVSLDKGIGKLPVGKYRIHHWLIERKDETDNTWKLKGQWFDKKGIFDVLEDQEVNLAVGEPVICMLDVKKKNTQHSFSHKMKGNLGEQIEITRNGNRAGAPKLRIENKQAGYDRTFTFEYG